MHINTFSYHNTLLYILKIFIYVIEHFKFYRCLSILILAQSLNRYTNKFYKNTENLQKNHAIITKSHSHIVLGIIGCFSNQPRNM